MPLSELSPVEVEGIILGFAAGLSAIYFGVRHYLRKRREITPKRWKKAMTDAAQGNTVNIGNKDINGGGYSAKK